MSKRMIVFVILVLPVGLYAQLGSPAATPLKQETSGAFFFGYSANVPHEYMGVEIGHFGASGLGWQIEMKVKTFDNHPQPTMFESDNIAHFTTGNVYENRMNLNFALNYGVAKSVAVYLGAGYARWDSADEVSVPSFNDLEWLEHDSKFSVNVLGGVIFRLSPIYLKVGFDSNPAGLAIGMGFGG